ncbi:sigma factor-like helix-turn-helix DNA-binding protein [Paenibacillus puerhi]|uniref:sigma factor-like helix-turn-helix DNA-binding protein n=1 Tax=Paenibacillus puerhi TaxID=2692622 RepID=UPI00135BC5B4
MDYNVENPLYYYREELYRFAWRIQYHLRKQRKCELLCFDDEQLGSELELDLVGNLHIEELIASIDSPKARYIVRRIYMDGMTEKEVAKELNITQQAVSKWKKKSLESIRRKWVSDQ